MAFKSCDKKKKDSYISEGVPWWQIFYNIKFLVLIFLQNYTMVVDVKSMLEGYWFLVLYIPMQDDLYLTAK